MKLKKFFKIKLNENTSFGKVTLLMVWFPEEHQWFMPSNIDDINYLKIKNVYKTFLNANIERIGLRNDRPDYIAIFLTPGKKLKRKLKEKTNNE